MAWPMGLSGQSPTRSRAGRNARHRTTITLLPPQTMRANIRFATRKMPIAMTGIASNGPSPGSNRGARPATLVSPDYLAKEKIDRPTDQPLHSVSRKFGAAVLSELTGRGRSLPEPDAIEGEAEEIEIEPLFRRKKPGHRLQPQH